MNVPGKYSVLHPEFHYTTAGEKVATVLHVEKSGDFLTVLSPAAADMRRKPDGKRSPALRFLRVDPVSAVPVGNQNISLPRPFRKAVKNKMSAVLCFTDGFSFFDPIDHQHFHSPFLKARS